MAARGGYSVAARLQSEVAMFPKGHGGFLPGDGDPDGFAARLRELLDRPVGWPLDRVTGLMSTTWATR
jgi:hypothetical protein